MKWNKSPDCQEEKLYSSTYNISSPYMWNNCNGYGKSIPWKKFWRKNITRIFFPSGTNIHWQANYQHIVIWGRYFQCNSTNSPKWYELWSACFRHLALNNNLSLTAWHWKISSWTYNMYVIFRGRYGRDPMVVEFTTTCAIRAYHDQSCEFEPRSWRDVLDTTLFDKVWQWLATDLWFSPGTLVSYTNITEILLKVALSTINQTKPSIRC